MKMRQELRPDAADTLGRLGRHWGWAVAFGVITLLAGIAVLAWPGVTLLVIAILFGIQLVVTGLFRFVSAFALDNLSGGGRVLMAVLGALSLIIGLYALRHVYITLLALALLLGIYWTVSGFVEVFTALSHRDMPGRGWSGLVGVLSIIAGLILLSYPGLSLLTLATIASIWLVVFGLMEISAGFRLRSQR
jgi:uncharacterized membrane protein HdeD (DUF308 family)